jgi:hypothetical protein
VRGFSERTTCIGILGRRIEDSKVGWRFAGLLVLAKNPVHYDVLR